MSIIVIIDIMIVVLLVSLCQLENSITDVHIRNGAIDHLRKQVIMTHSHLLLLGDL